ncbi:DUF4173 domain-containing protein [Robiginitalea sp. M366]|uniref:DUF4153 domain-containing protein n=1 Tax=Robiginitalea aestuariiviva TaxID=3036903 RepID=UPI00240D4A68|nr:DUF4153 domain-containing protein [Robiginitalea aestuariiviva]MDG1572190.1 DUF4173 domain-containing protein [Robiginitalea aestuariiviva]
MNKTTPYILALIGGFLFSSLFYEKEPGLNVLLLALYTTATLVWLKGERPLPVFLLSAYLYSALGCFIQPSPPAVLVHVLSLVVLAGGSATGRASLYTQGLTGALNLPLGMLLGQAEGFRNPSDTPAKPAGPIGRIFGGILISFVLLWVFGGLYAEANPVFEDLLGRIDLSFLSLGWFWLTVVGFLLYLNLLRPFDPQRILQADAHFPDTLRSPAQPFTPQQEDALERENLWGRMALGSLSVLLLLYLVLDYIYLAQGSVGTPALQSQAVHQGVYALIFSLFLAMGVLLVFFRGRLNFYTKAGPLRRLAYLWLGLNTLLLMNTAIKNALYIYHSGLTFKRLGVFVFLALVGVGLATTFFKLRDTRSLFYLLRKNALSLFAILVGVWTLPWTSWITTYNLSYVSSPDLEYLQELPLQNAPRLLRYAAENPHLPEPVKQELQERNQKFQAEMQERTWQEWTLDNLQNP